MARPWATASHEPSGATAGTTTGASPATSRRMPAATPAASRRRPVGRACAASAGPAPLTMPACPATGPQILN